MASITKCRRCTAVYDVAQHTDESVFKIDWINNVLCKDCVIDFRTWRNQKHRVRLLTQLDEENPGRSVLCETLSKAIDMVTLPFGENGQEAYLTKQEHEALDELYDEMWRLNSPDPTLDEKALAQPNQDEFNEFLFSSYKRLVARHSANEMLERCQAVYTTGKRCKNWACHEHGDAFLCHMHRETALQHAYNSQGGRRRRLQLITDPIGDVVHCFVIAATNPEQLRAELVRVAPSNWLKKLGLLKKAA